MTTADITAANEMGIKRASIASATTLSRPNSHKNGGTDHQEDKPHKDAPSEGATSRKQSYTSGYHGNMEDASSNMADLVTETGSQMENFSDDESGNDGDLDTITEYTLPEDFSAMRIPTREELHREYARVLSNRLTQAAIMAGSRNNITVMVILLPGCGL